MHACSFWHLHSFGLCSPLWQNRITLHKYVREEKQWKIRAGVPMFSPKALFLRHLLRKKGTHVLSLLTQKEFEPAYPTS